MTTEALDTPSAVTGPLHSALVVALPFFVKEPFSETPRLNIRELKVALDMSHEGIYKWLRTNRLSTKNAQKLVTLANSDRNLDVLAQLGRTPPRIEDLAQFYLA